MSRMVWSLTLETFHTRTSPQDKPRLNTFVCKRRVAPQGLINFSRAGACRAVECSSGAPCACAARVLPHGTEVGGPPSINIWVKVGSFCMI